MGSASRYIDDARREVGVTENPPGSNRTPFGVTYGWNGVYWCAIFLCAMAIRYGLRKNIDYPFTASVFQARSWAKANGNWSSVPHVGDWVVFEYSHIEVVTQVTQTRIKTIGGNTSLIPGVRDRDGGGVWEHWRPRNSSISGYIRIDYSAGLGKHSPGGGGGTTGLPGLPGSSKGIFGMTKSKSLGGTHNVHLKADRWVTCSFAPGHYTLAQPNGQVIDILSEWVVNKALPANKDVQFRYFLIEYHNWNKDNHVYREGDRGKNVKVLQRWIGAKDDGVLGGNSAKKLRAVQKKLGLEQDAVVGSATKKKLSNGRRITSYGAHEITGSAGSTFKSTQFRRTISKAGQDRRLRVEALARQKGVVITRTHHERLPR